MSVFRLAASSYTGALLTIGTRVRMCKDESFTEGVIWDIREGVYPNVQVAWPEATRWEHERHLMRVGAAVRGPL